MIDEEFYKAKRAKEMVELCDKILKPLCNEECYGVSLVFHNNIYSNGKKEVFLIKGQTTQGSLVRLLTHFITEIKESYKQELNDL